MSHTLTWASHLQASLHELFPDSQGKRCVSSVWVLQDDQADGDCREHIVSFEADSAADVEVRDYCLIALLG